MLAKRGQKKRGNDYVKAMDFKSKTRRNPSLEANLASLRFLRKKTKPKSVLY
jgi:hypothetical protein